MRWISILAGLEMALLTSAAPVAASAQDGLVIEEVANGSAGRSAGLELGDLLLSWSRGVESGTLDSPWALSNAEIEQGPRGLVTLNGRRGADSKTWVLGPGPWGLTLRPVLPTELQALYDDGRKRFQAGQFSEAAKQWRAAAELPASGPRWLPAWLLSDAAEAAAKAKQWMDCDAAYQAAIQKSASLGSHPRILLLQAWAGSYRQRNDLVQAEKRYQEALAESEKDQAGKSLGTARILNSLGAVADANGNREPVRAEAYYRQALIIREKLAPDSLVVAGSLNNLGNLAIERSMPAEAEEYHRRALAIREKLVPGSLDVALSLNNLGVLAKERGHLEQAEAYHRQALTIREKVVSGSLDVAVSLNNLSNVVMERGNLAQAEEYQQRALVIREKLTPDSPDVAASLNNLGRLANSRGHLAQAERFYRDALTIWEKLIPGSLDVATGLSNLAMVIQRRGNLVQAETYCRAALALREKLAPDSLDVARSLGNLGIISFYQVDLVQADRYYRQALKIFEKLAPNGLEVTECLNELGILAKERGDFAAAETYYRQGLTIRKQLAPGSLDVAESLGNLGVSARDRGDLAQAETYLSQALSIDEKLAPGSLDLAEDLFSLGSILEKRGDLAPAEAYYRRAVDIEERDAPGSVTEAESLHALGLLLRRQGQLASADSLLSRALDALENQTATLGGTEGHRLQFRAEHAGYYRDYEALLLSQQQPERAFYVLERSRARSMLAMLAERDLMFASDLPPEIQQARQRNAVEYDRVQAQLSQVNSSKDAAKLQLLQARLHELTNKRAELSEQVRRASPRLAALQYPQPLDLAATRQTLDPGSVLLSYSVGPQETVLFVVQSTDAGSGLDVFHLPVGEAALRTQVQKFRQLIQLRTASNLVATHQQAQALYNLLLRPAEVQIAASQRLLIIPDGPLDILPFAALRRGSEYLIELKPLYTAISATVYAELKKTRRASPPANVTLELAAFGAPRYPKANDSEVVTRGNPELRSAMGRGFDFSPLPFSREEVRAIAALFPDRSETFLDADATEERAKSIGKQVRYLHFATHGVLDERFPLNSAVVLSIPENLQEGHDNGLLQAWEIFDQVRLDADLVVLSGCRTGLGQEVSGEGLVGLTRAFQYAGARSVLASLWSVDDRRTAQLMKSFYVHLAKGESKDRALQAAQAELIHTQAPPFYWASFALNGDWR